jgi:hypothetical protein
MNKFKNVGILCLAVLFAVGCATPAEEKPTADTKPAAAEPAPAAQSPDSSYDVVRGDHLWGISANSRIYGNPYQWPLIYKANRDKIQDADLIRPGQVFSINRNASSGEVDAAVQHARTRGQWSLGVTEDSDKAYLAR